MIKRGGLVADLCAWAAGSLVLLVALALAACVMHPRPHGQQAVDNLADTSVEFPKYPLGAGPRVAIDSGHNNLHTLSGGYAPFARLLGADGYVVQDIHDFTPQSLGTINILVIANPQLPSDSSGSKASLFSAEEVRQVRAFVEQGGSLMLILDHMPFPANGKDVATAFGFDFLNGFALPRTGSRFDRRTTFTRTNGGLLDHPISNGAAARERVDKVVTFTGSAFIPPPSAKTILRFTKAHDHRILFPDVPWEFKSTTPTRNATALAQGATLVVGKGRVAVFGEAAMFTTQTSKWGTKMGFHDPEATQNKQFALNVMHWLSKAPGF